jgi:hypothetical protein
MSRDRAQKFKDLAEKRVSRVIRDINLVGNLSNKSNYDYSNDDAMKIIRAIENELKILKMKFVNMSSKDKSFKL